MHNNKPIPSFTFVPAGKKVGKLYSQLPNNGNGDFDFSRNSTASFTDSDGLIKYAAIDEPRFEYNGSCPHLLMEPSRTNEIVQSDNFSFSGWVTLINGAGIEPVITENAAIAPDGTHTAARMIFERTGTTSSDYSMLRQQIVPAVTGGTVGSWYVKSATGFDQEIGMSVGGNEKIRPVTTEWTRIIDDEEDTAFHIRIGVSAGTQTYADILVWGPQVEQGDYPTTYIPTDTTPVTRVSDEMATTTATTSNEFNSVEGVLYCEIQALTDLHDGNFDISINDGGTTNRVIIFYSAVLNRVNALVIADGVTQASFFTTMNDITDLTKVAVKWAENDFSFWVNGVEVATDNSGDTFDVDTLNTVSMDNGAGSDDFTGRIHNVSVYNRALNDTELQKLTQI